MVKNIELKEIKQIGYLPVGKISALFGALFGVIGALYILFLYPVVVQSAIAQGQAVTEIPKWMSIVALFGYPLLYFIAGIIFAGLYNWFAKLVGGIKVNLS